LERIRCSRRECHSKRRQKLEVRRWKKIKRPPRGTIAPPRTTFYGLYDRAYSFDQKVPFDLPVRYRERRDRFDLSTPLRLTGHQPERRTGRIDLRRKIESLVGRFVYNEENNRALAVHSAAMISFDVHDLRRDVLSFVAERVNDDATTHRTVRAGASRLGGPCDLQGLGLRIDRRQTEAEGRYPGPPMKVVLMNLLLETSMLILLKKLGLETRKIRNTVTWKTL
jgi:hypothetical protein